MIPCIAVINSINKDRMVETGEDFLDVCVHICEATDENNKPLEKPKFVEERKFGYPSGTDKQVIIDDVKKMIDSYNARLVAKEENKEQDALQEKDTTTINSLVGGFLK